MVEQIMFIGIGFLIAGLLVIGVIPLVHARAVRLTMRRLEALTPLSIAEIQADKDQLRAEFAMTMSRLEMSVEQMKAKTTNQLAELSRKSEAIGRLKLELGEKTAALFALEAKEKQLSDDLQTTQTELAAKTVALEEAERALASTRTELVQVTANFNDASVAAGGQRELLDLVAALGVEELALEEAGLLLLALATSLGRLPPVARHARPVVASRHGHRTTPPVRAHSRPVPPRYFRPLRKATRYYR